jgi:hypothetical protein
MRLLLGAALLGAAIATPLLAQPAPQAPPAAVSVVVPVVGSITGANEVRWKTDLEVHNTEAREVTAIIELALDPDRFVMQQLAPGQRLRFIDVMGELFGVDGMLSPLIVRTSGRRSVVIRASTYGTRGGEVYPATPIAINYGTTYAPRRVLQNLSFSDDYRTNIGLANLGTEPAEFLLALQRIPGRNLALTRVPVPPTALWHFSIQQAFPLITQGENFSVVVETSATDTQVYGSVIENATHTARFIDPVPR